MAEEAGHKALGELSRVVREATKQVDEKMVNVRDHLRQLKTSRSNFTEDQSFAEADALKEPADGIEGLIKQLEEAKKSISEARLEMYDVTRRQGGAQNRRRTDEGADSGVYSADSRVLSSSGCPVTHPTGRINPEKGRTLSFTETAEAKEHDEKSELVTTEVAEFHKES